MPETSSTLANQRIEEKIVFSPFYFMRPFELILYKEYVEYIMYKSAIHLDRPYFGSLIPTVEFFAPDPTFPDAER